MGSYIRVLSFDVDGFDVVTMKWTVMSEARWYGLVIDKKKIVIGCTEVLSEWKIDLLINDAIVG